MAAIIVASLILLGVYIVFTLRRPDPKHKYIFALYECISEQAESPKGSIADSGLPRTA